jgi:hypothetical protein
MKAFCGWTSRASRILSLSSRTVVSELTASGARPLRARLEVRPPAEGGSHRPQRHGTMQGLQASLTFLKCPSRAAVYGTRNRRRPLATAQNVHHYLSSWYLLDLLDIIALPIRQLPVISCTASSFAISTMISAELNVSAAAFASCSRCQTAFSHTWAQHTAPRCLKRLHVMVDGA